MSPPDFTPTRSRWRLTTILATCLLLNPYAWTSPNSRIFAHGANADVAFPDTIISPTVLPAGQDVLRQLGDDGSADASAGYAPDFDYFDRNLLGRQEPQTPQPSPAPQVFELKNNEKMDMEIVPGETKHFVLKRSQPRMARAEQDEGGAQDARDLESRQAGSRVWVSANTCRQPMPNGPEAPKHSRQLDMYISTSPNNQKPGPGSTDGTVTPPTGLLFDQGFASINLSTTSDVYIGIAAPNAEKDWTGSWSFDIAASFNGPYHSYNATNPFLYMIDTDSESALFITYNLSEPNATDVDKWRDNNPFSMYAFEVGDQSNITGMERSLCALKSVYSNSSLNTSTTITTKFGGGLPKSQFHIQGLKKATKYNGFLTVEGSKDALTLPGGGVVRDGGMVFQSFQWTTKSDESCQVLFDLTFCNQVAYAVPSSPKFTSNNTGLKALYDNQAEKYYANFNRSLAQIACDTTSEAQYSLARTCKDCETDYKNWLCSVLIPRCEDWNAKEDFLQERNVNELLPDGQMTFGNNVSAEIMEEKRKRYAFNGSRNSMIDEEIKPGPYKEMLPCEDLCFDIVRSCPARLGFSCPNSPARELTYGKRERGSEVLTCSFPGAVVKLNVQGAANSLRPHLGPSIVATMAFLALGWI